MFKLSEASRRILDESTTGERIEDEYGNISVLDAPSIYVSGPMTGREGYNYAAFHHTAERLREDGWNVRNPAEHFDGRTDLDRATYMRADFQAVLEVDALMVLPGWEDSPGARAEVLMAREMEVPVYSWAEYSSTGDLTPDVSTDLVVTVYCGDTPAPAETVTAEAERIVYGGRGDDYGHPREDFTRTATILTALISHKLAPGEFVAPEDWARFMVAAKLSRDVHAPKRDNRIDIAGYALCLDRLETGR